MKRSSPVLGHVRPIYAHPSSRLLALSGHLELVRVVSIRLF